MRTREELRSLIEGRLSTASAKCLGHARIAYRPTAIAAARVRER
jgi:hypothetical protein